MNREELIEEAAKVAKKEYQNAHWGKNAFENVVEAVFDVFEKAQCKRCGKLAEGYAFIGGARYCHPDDGVDCYTLASHELTSLANQAFIEKAQAPTDDERGALPIAPRETWDWGTCVVCGSKEVSDRGMVIMGASNGAPYVGRIAWCDQLQECREDLRQTSFLLTESDVKVIDGFRRPAQTEPTDAQVKAGVRALSEYTGLEIYPDEMRAALKAAFTEGNEDKL